MLESQRRPGTPATAARVVLLGRFDLIGEHGPASLRIEARRLLAYLAVHPRPHAVRAVCSRLWSDVPDALAFLTMRDAVDEIERVAGGIIVESDAEIALAAHVVVDLTEAIKSIRQLDDVHAYRHELLEPLRCDVLPEWSETWVSVERERFHHLRLNAMEELCRRLTDAGRHADAIEVGVAAVEADPRRERARRALIEAHLAAGHISEAVTVYDSFVELQATTGAAPTAELMGLFPPSPAWPVLHVRRSIMPTIHLPGLRPEHPRRRLSAGSTYSGR
ncbi:MAG: transcriptional regulator, family [Pseudonocardia sp.]|nr:transcriptional regulator, family [Pseudonocardia sp.]